MSNGIQLTQEEKLLVVRAHRLQQLVSVDGYKDLRWMMHEIEEEALAHLYAYDGTEDHETAVRAFQWKTVKAQNEKLLGRIAQRIKDGEAVALSKVPAELRGQTDKPAEFTGVRPQCDVDAEAEQSENAPQADAPPKPPLP